MRWSSTCVSSHQYKIRTLTMNTTTEKDEELLNSSWIAEQLRNGSNIEDIKFKLEYTSNWDTVPTRKILVAISNAIDEEEIQYYHIPDYNSDGFQKRHFGWYVKMYNENHTIAIDDETPNPTYINNSSPDADNNQQPLNNFTA